MDLALSRVDYFHVGSSHKNCLKVLPLIGDSESQQQKVGTFDIIFTDHKAYFCKRTFFANQIVAGNREGLIQIAFWNKYEAAFAYKIPLGQPIVSLQLGGAIGGLQTAMGLKNILKSNARLEKW